MERGLLWLPLLVVFIGLAWAGWHEYQKVQAYEQWAQQFDRSKYDIRTMLGQTGDQLVWGQPTRQGPVNLQALSLANVETLSVRNHGQPVDPEYPPARVRQPELRFELGDGRSYTIPFTDLEITLQWFRALQQRLQALKSAST